MIKTRMRKILRDVIARKGRTFLVSLAIFIGVAGTITLFSMRDIIVGQLEEDIQTDKLSMLQIFVGTPSGSTLNNEADLAAIKDYPGLTQLVAGQQGTLYFKKKTDDKRFDEATVTGYSDPLDSLSLEPMRLTEGQWPTPGSKQLVLEMRMAEDLGFKAGDTILLQPAGQTEKDANGEPLLESWTISGIVFHPYAQAPKTAAYALLPDVEYISGIPGYNILLARFTDYKIADDNYLDFTQSFAAKTPYRAGFTQKQDPSKNQLIESAKLIGNVLGLMALMALLVSGFLVFNVITSIVVEQKRLIGVMKSLGATRADNFMMYSGLAFAYGLIGVIPGVILGIIGGQITSSLLAPQLNTVLSGFHMSFGAIIIGVAVGLAIPVVGSLLPVFNGTQVTILDAMTDLGISGSGGQRRRLSVTTIITYLVLGIIFFIPLLIYTFIWLIMAAALWVLRKMPLPLNFRHGINSVNVKKRRLVLTVFTLALAVGAFMGIFAVFASISEGINSFLDTYNVDVFVFSNSSLDAPKIADALNTIPEFNPAEEGFQLQIDFEGYKYDATGGGPPFLLVYGYDINSDHPAFKYDLAKGEGLTDANYATGIVLSDKLAESMHKQLGDTVQAILAGKTLELTVVGLGDFPIEQAWMDWRTMATAAESFDADGNPAPQGYFVTTKKAEPTAHEVDNLIDDAKAIFASRSITSVQFFNFVSFTETFTQFIVIFQIIFSSAALLIALVGALGLLTALSISVFERQKEIGVMRSIGAGSGTIATQFLTEGLLVGIIAWIVGIPVSLIFSQMLIQAAQFGDTFQVSYSPIALVIGLVGLLVITTAASIGPSLGAARKTVSDILRYQ